MCTFKFKSYKTFKFEIFFPGEERGGGGVKYHFLVTFVIREEQCGIQITVIA